MRACGCAGFGDASVLRPIEIEEPVVASGEVLIDVVAAGVNRADVAQREGKYPPPPGASEILGLEVSGVVSRVGDGVTLWRPGDRVCALLAGGGYAERVAVDARHLLPVPETIELADAAALPEALATVWFNVFQRGQLRAGELLLIHGGSSGIGTMAIQLAKARGARVAVTAGSAEKLDACAELGADISINYREQDFVAELLDRTHGTGADVILDAIGGDYIDRDVRALAPDGRILVIGNQSGGTTELNLGRLMGKRGQIHGTALRAQSALSKAAIIDSLAREVWPLVVDGIVRPVVDSRFALDDAADAHRRLESSAHVGKILLLV